MNAVLVENLSENPDGILYLDAMMDDTPYYEEQGDIYFPDGRSPLDKFMDEIISEAEQEVINEFAEHYQEDAEIMAEFFMRSGGDWNEYIQEAQDFWEDMGFDFDGAVLEFTRDIYEDMEEMAYDYECQAIEEEYYEDVADDIDAVFCF